MIDLKTYRPANYLFIIDRPMGVGCEGEVYIFEKYMYLTTEKLWERLLVFWK